MKNLLEGLIFLLKSILRLGLDGIIISILFIFQFLSLLLLLQ